MIEQHLPSSAQNLIRLIGLPNTMQLVNEFGGTTFPVAVGTTSKGQARFEMLAEVIGTEAADILTAEYAREHLYIPNCKAAMRKARDRAIHGRFDALSMQGYSSNAAVAELAREHNLSDRRVWEILKVLPE